MRLISFPAKHCSAPRLSLVQKPFVSATAGHASFSALPVMSHFTTSPALLQPLGPLQGSDTHEPAWHSSTLAADSQMNPETLQDVPAAGLPQDMETNEYTRRNKIEVRRRIRDLAKAGKGAEQNDEQLSSPARRESNETCSLM